MQYLIIRVPLLGLLRTGIFQKSPCNVAGPKSLAFQTCLKKAFVSACAGMHRSLGFQILFKVPSLFEPGRAGCTLVVNQMSGMLFSGQVDVVALAMGFRFWFDSHGDHTGGCKRKHVHSGNINGHGSHAVCDTGGICGDTGNVLLLVRIIETQKNCAEDRRGMMFPTARVWVLVQGEHVVLTAATGQNFPEMCE